VPWSDPDSADHAAGLSATVVEDADDDGGEDREVLVEEWRGSEHPLREPKRAADVVADRARAASRRKRRRSLVVPGRPPPGCGEIGGPESTL
jgi:hypothetical protein